MFRRGEVSPARALAKRLSPRSTPGAAMAARNAPGPRWPGPLLPPYLDGHRYFELAERYPFDPAATTCSLVNGWWLAEAAALAYHDFDDVERLLPLLFPDVAALGASEGDRDDDLPLDARGYVAWNDRCALIIFCGTRLHERARLGRDLVIDMDLRPPVPWGRGHVHRGFHDAFDGIWADVERKLDELALTGQRSFWFAGHSMGAAIATLVASRWRAGPRRAVYTFGSPRVGDRFFVADWDRIVPVYRFVHDHDLVTRIPPKIPLLGLNYADLGTEQYHFTADGAPARSTSFRTELLALAAEMPARGAGLARDLAARVVQGGPAAFAKDWRSFVEALSDNAVTALTDHAPIYYIDYFRRQLAPA